VTLRDRQTIATVIPFASKDQVPASLLRYLADQLNKEIEGGDTYPMMETMPHEKFASYWFQNFGAIMLLGSIKGPGEVAALFPDPPSNTSHVDGAAGTDWSKTCLGSFYIKPNYPGRSSHVCNAGFLVTDAARNRGVGRLMGESYLDWAPKLGYTYSVFNLVYETNVASCKIWDALGFKRIGRVKGCGNLRSYPDRLVDAIIYGRDLLPGEFPEDLVTEERFDKIKYYLKYGKYPAGADRAEKSRLRSAATHYKLVEPDTLMLKDKEVVPDPRRQYDIARETHVAREHGGINKTTAHIAERYHWSRIKETVSDVIRNCTECKELGKMPAPGNGNGRGRGPAAGSSAGGGSRSAATSSSNTVSPPSVAPLSSQASILNNVPPSSVPVEYGYPSPEDVAAHGGGITPSHTLRDPSASPLPSHQGLPLHNPMLQDRPQHHHHHHHHDGHLAYQPIDPQMISQPHSHPDATDPYGYGTSAHDHDPQTETDFQALLNATEDSHDAHVQHASDEVHVGASETDDAAQEREREAMARDLDMLIDPGDEEEEDSAMTGVEAKVQEHLGQKAP
jgi:GNAT superfamily N-acetyltransferase